MAREGYALLHGARGQTGSVTLRALLDSQSVSSGARAQLMAGQ